MQIANGLKKILEWVSLPIRLNATFFVFMYVLGVVCAYLTLPSTKDAHVYENLYLELFLDLYIVCTLLALLPQTICKWVRRFLYVILYLVATIDVYCFVKFDSTLTPTMLLLVNETNSHEAKEFLQTHLTADTLFGPVGWILLIMLANILVCFARKNKKISKLLKPLHYTPTLFYSLFGIVCLALLIWSIIESQHNKEATWKLMTGNNIGDVEHALTAKDHAQLYTPISRLVFSVYANSLAKQQINKLIEAANNVRVDSCQYRSPNIILIIGESLGPHHSQQYGYFMPTTPRQIAREKTGYLTKFSDVVAPWNLTSFVFKSLFSMHVVGQEGEWCDYPLFPELFRKAGYQVTFLTNQFLPKAKEAVYDFSGGFFLNNPSLSEAQFDLRNEKLHPLDEGLLDDYDNMLKNKQISLSDSSRNLIIFHLMGQHVSYQLRYPKNQKKFQAFDYRDKRPELTGNKRKVLADYDNAVLYNDSIVDQIMARFEHEDAIVIYMPDHGEECFEGKRGFICRNHAMKIDYDMARFEFAIPFWIWCSPKYAARHPEVFNQVVEAKDRRLMIDAIAHTLLYLAGIHSPDYHAEYDVLSSQYNENRPRILKGGTDYDSLKMNVQDP
ncbi:MAG: sulfatase-like hydrolase/transferase [Prevotella sp.]|nr:sulfatase-like hydrolase/transferase [Prevotella sp.]